VGVSGEMHCSINEKLDLGGSTSLIFERSPDARFLGQFGHASVVREIYYCPEFL
jgi:hypothetical protein